VPIRAKVCRDLIVEAGSAMDVNRNRVVSGRDVVRLVQLLAGGLNVASSTGFNGATVAGCP